MRSPWPTTMPALITPFSGDGAIDVTGHRHNVETAIRTGAGGILIAGSTGEGPYLEPGERSTLVSAAREVDETTVLLCGVSAETDRQSCAQIDEAAMSGADAVLVVTPVTLVRNRTDAVIAYYDRVAAASPVPVLLYTVPPVTGYALPVEAILRLSSHPNISGMKDSGGDVSRLDQLSDVLTPEFVVYAGSSRSLAASSSRNAHGAITASSNYAWSLADAAGSGDQAAQAKLTELVSVIEPFGVPGTKYAASVVGMRSGAARLPLQPLTDDARSEIRSILHEILSVG